MVCGEKVPLSVSTLSMNDNVSVGDIASLPVVRSAVVTKCLFKSSGLIWIRFAGGFKTDLITFQTSFDLFEDNNFLKKLILAPRIFFFDKFLSSRYFFQ